MLIRRTNLIAFVSMVAEEVIPPTFDQKTYNVQLTTHRP